MRKVILIILTLMLMVSLCACEKAPEIDIDDVIRIEVQSEAATEVLFNYGKVKNVLATVTNTEDEGNGKYEVNGYITVIDNYGDKYKATFDATVRIDENGEGDCTYFDMDTPRK